MTLTMHPVECGCCADLAVVLCDLDCWFPDSVEWHTHPCPHCQPDAAGADVCPVCDGHDEVAP